MNVPFVLVTELTLLIVIVQLILMTLMKLSVLHVQMNVKNVIWTEIVPFVLLTETQHQNVHVILTISKLWFKDICSAKFVMLDVMIVKISSTCVTLVLNNLEELTHHNVAVH